MATVEQHNFESSKGLKHIRVQPPSGLSLVSLQELWAFRELLLFLTWRDVKVRYKQTMIGAAWAVLQPFMLMVVFTMFVGRMQSSGIDTVPYSLFVFCGLLPWTFFASAISNAGNSVVGSEKLVTKVYFPRMIIPFASIGSSLVDVFFSSLVLFALLFWNGIGLTWSVCFAPFVLVLIALTSLGIGAFLAALHVAYRDVKHVLPFLIQMWLFATPSIYMNFHGSPASHARLSPWVQFVCQLNPMVSLVNAFRCSILNQPLSVGELVQATVIALVTLLVGCAYFRWVEHRFADII